MDPAWSRPSLAAVAVLAAALMAWGLGRNGYANGYYASAVYAASKSWSSFLFNGLDLSGYLTVDKTPLSVWMMALSARVFGFGGVSMLLPNALCGVASVLVLHNAVKRSLGPRVAILAALALALTPVMVVVSRFNNPDALLVLLLVCSAWAATRAMESGRTRHIVLCGVLVGLAFNTKMLQAYLVVPGLAVAFLAAGPGTRGRRLVQLGAGGAAMLAVSLVWVSAMMLVPAADRPWVADTTTNSWWQLVFGGNGLARIGVGFEGSPASAGPGPLRLFSAETGGQIAWLLPLAAIGLAGGLLATRRDHRRALRRGAFLLWGGWALVHIVVFSVVVNIFHPYYTSALAPAVAVLAANGLVLLWDRRRAAPGVRLIAGAAVLGTAGLAVLLLGRAPGFVPWLAWVVAALAVLCVVGGRALARLRRPGRRLRAIVVAAGLAATFGGPAAYAIATVGRDTSGVDPVAGPGVTSHALAHDRGRAALIRYLSAHRGGARFLAAVDGSIVAAPMILATHQPIVTMGGYGGTDPAPTAGQLRELVGTGQLRFVVLSTRSAAARGSESGIGLGGGRTRAQWVTGHCRPLGLAPVVASPLGPSPERVYDCAGAA